MARFGIVCGLLLCVDTAFALFGSTEKSALYFLPMMIGIPTLFFGVVALNPHRRRHSLALAAGLCCIGFLAGLGHLSHLFSRWQNTHQMNLHSTRVVIAMVVITAMYLICYAWKVAHRPKNGVFEGTGGV